MPITISLLIRLFFKYTPNSVSFLTSITWVLEFLAINLENFIRLNFKSLRSPAAYKGHIITKSDFAKDFENSFLRAKTLEYLCGSKTLIIFLFLLTLLTPSKI